VRAHGFARVHCSRCGKDELVAFSCKGRGFCPSCGARRMADLAAHLVDEVLPHVPVRQWVLSLPHRLRYLLAFDPKLCAAVRRIFVRALLAAYRERAEREGISGGRGGAVVFVQRFGSALNLNLHFHALLLDGVVTCESPFTRAVFHPAAELEDQDVEHLTCVLQRRITRYLQRRGHLPRDDGDEASEPETDEPLLALLGAASIQGRVALGPNRGAAVTRLRRPSETRPRYIPGLLCCDLDGFSLHARVEIGADERERLERLCRYVARPPIATDRLSLSSDGKVVYRLRRRWRDGTEAVVFEPLTFIERLAALVPRPRTHLMTYHGVLAPAAAWRDLVVPGSPAGLPTSPRTPRQRLTWAELLKRVFAIDVLICPRCDGPRKLIALINDGLVVRKILEHLGLPTEPPPMAPARAPPEPEFAFHEKALSSQGQNGRLSPVVTGSSRSIRRRSRSSRRLPFALSRLQPHGEVVAVQEGVHPAGYCHLVDELEAQGEWRSYPDGRCSILDRRAGRIVRERARPEPRWMRDQAGTESPRLFARWKGS